MSYPPPPPQPYGYGYYQGPRTSGRAIAVMVLGIVGLCLFCSYGIGLIPAIVALALAPGARREIHGSGGAIVGESQLKAGVVCSWVTVGLVAASVVAIVIIWIIAASSSSSY